MTCSTRSRASDSDVLLDSTCSANSVTMRGARREDPDADFKVKLKFIYKQKRHEARTKDAAEPDIKNLNFEKITRQNKNRLRINKQDCEYETKTRRV